MSGAALDPTLRLARIEDCAPLTDLALRSKRSNGYDDAFMAACREELTVTPAHLAVAECWVAERNALIGCVSLRDGATAGAGEIEAFFVDPEWRRRGVGKLLFARTLERAAARRFGTLALDSDPFAEPYYRALGFVTVGETPSGSIPGRVIPRMELAL